MPLSDKPSKVIPVAEAARLWTTYGFSSPEDLVLEDLAFALGLVVLEGPLDGAEARLIRKGDRGLIRVKDDIPEAGRKRFAIGHEIGHWLLHKAISQVLACTSEDMIAKYRASAPEVEANYFAAELLMPERLFARHILRKQPSLGLVKQLATLFSTTLTATAIRFVEVTDECCALVVSDDGRIRWWRGSSSFEGRFWLEPRTPVPEKSVAAAISRGESSQASQELDLDVWLDADTDSADEAVSEEAILLPRYRQVLSFLWLS